MGTAILVQTAQPGKTGKQTSFWKAQEKPGMLFEKKISPGKLLGIKGYSGKLFSTIWYFDIKKKKICFENLSVLEFLFMKEYYIYND